MPPPTFLQPLLPDLCCELGEGPVWDEATGHLHWVDIIAGHIHSLNPTTAELSTLTLGAACGFAVPTEQAHQWVIGHGANVALLDTTTGAIRTIASLSAHEGFRCNDGKCDPQGRLWAGIMPYAWGEFTGTFFRMEANKPPVVQRTGVGCSNGLAWSSDGNWFYYIDSLTHRIDRYPWDAGTGTLGARATHATFAPAAHGLPDGMTIDRDGHLWVAFYGGGCVRQIHGQTGRILDQIDLPVTQVTSCTFGGADYGTLYITTASQGLDPAARAAQPLAGRTFSCRPGATGVPVDRCRL